MTSSSSYKWLGFSGFLTNYFQQEFFVQVVGVFREYIYFTYYNKLFPQEFFVQVVGVFREYIADQIAVLEDKLVRCQGDYKMSKAQSKTKDAYQLTFHA